MNKALYILRGNSLNSNNESYEILYDKILKGCVNKSAQISDLSGLK